MSLLVKLAWRSIWRHKRRTFITIFSIAFSLGLAVFFISFAEGVYAELIDDAVKMQAGHLTIENKEYRTAPAVDLLVDDVRKLRHQVEQIPAVAKTKAIVVGQGVAKSSAGAVGVAISGVEPRVEQNTSPLSGKIIAGKYLADNDTNSVVVGKNLAQRLHLENSREMKKIHALLEPVYSSFHLDVRQLDDLLRVRLSIGKKLVLTTNDVNGQIVEELVRVKGIFETGSVQIDGYYVQVPISFARRLFGIGDDQASQLGILLSSGSDRDKVIFSVNKLIANEADAKSISVKKWEEVMPDLAAYIKIDGGSNYVFQGILIFLVMFTIFNTILMSVLERRREFGMLMAIGTPYQRIKKQVLMETVFIAAWGVLMGLVLGGLGGYALQVNGLDLSKLYPEGITVSGMAFDMVIHAKVEISTLALVGGLVFGATILLCLYPMGRIKKIPVAEVIR